VIFVKNEKYNGWSNYDTWLVVLWLNNDYNNYQVIQHYKNGVGTKKLEDFTKLEFYDSIKRLYYGDKINWNRVNLNEVKESLLEE
jgi:hypothetical protein